MSKILSFVKNNKLISSVLFISCTIYLSYSVILSSNSDCPGDGLEYTLMTESVYNHGTPDVTATDVKLYKKEIEKYVPWEKQSRYKACDQIISFLEKKDQKNPLERVDGFALSKNKNLYSIHFFTYSLAIVPVKFLLKPFNIHPVKVIYVANVVFILGVLFFILFYSPFKEWENIIIAGLFLFSTLHFYVVWPHPEVFVSCLIFLGVYCFFLKKQYLGIFLCSIAVTQYQPMSIFVLLMVIYVAYQERFKMKPLLFLALSSFWVILPALFYYVNFGHTNLVKEFGFLDTKFITTTRVFGFFMDPNQGLILNYPLLFPTYLVFISYYFYKKIKQKEKSFSVFDWIPLVLIITVAIVSTMGNWSHGQAVTNRYVLYIGTLLLSHFIILFIKLRHLKWVKTFIVLSLITQVVTVKLFGGIFSSWDGDRHKPSAIYILDNYPELYNPDPHIFYQRTQPYESSEFYLKGLAYLDKNNTFKKAIVNVNHLDKVDLGGLSIDQLKKLTKDKRQQYGWVYLHKSDFKEKLRDEEVSEVITTIEKNK